MHQIIQHNFTSGGGKWRHTMRYPGVLRGASYQKCMTAIQSRPWSHKMYCCGLNVQYDCKSHCQHEIYSITLWVRHDRCMHGDTQICTVHVHVYIHVCTVQNVNICMKSIKHVYMCTYTCMDTKVLH